MESLRHLFSFKVISTSGFHFRFCGRQVRFLRRPMSDNVGGVKFGSGMVENVGVGFGIALSSVSIQKLFPLPVSTSGFVADKCVSDVGRCWAMSAVPNLCRAWLEIGGQQLEWRCYLFPFTSYCYVQFPHVDFCVLSRHFGTSG